MFITIFILPFLMMAVIYSIIQLDDGTRFVDVDYESQLRRALHNGDTASAVQAIRLLNR